MPNCIDVIFGKGVIQRNYEHMQKQNISSRAIKLKHLVLDLNNTFNSMV